MKRSGLLAVLMAVTILGITGFQLYWLRQNYEREKKTLDIKAEVTFRETIFHLQASKLRLDGLVTDSSDKRRVKILMPDGENVKVRFGPKEKIVSTINVIRNKLNDSLKGEGRGGMIVTMDRKHSGVTMDSIKIISKDSLGHNRIPRPGQDHIFNILYDVDSLQDSIKLDEINTAYSHAMKKEEDDHTIFHYKVRQRRCF